MSRGTAGRLDARRAGCKERGNGNERRNDFFDPKKWILRGRKREKKGRGMLASSKFSVPSWFSADFTSAFEKALITVVLQNFQIWGIKYVLLVTLLFSAFSFQFLSPTSYYHSSLWYGVFKLTRQSCWPSPRAKTLQLWPPSTWCARCPLLAGLLTLQKEHDQNLEMFDKKHGNTRRTR